jgi:hypothetical protein
MTHFPPSDLYEKRKKALRTVGIVLSALMVVAVLAILLFIVRSESAHDELSCPFTRRSERTLEGAVVVEETRSCLPEAEERRWLVSRNGGTPHEFARKRLPKEHFSDDRAVWVLSLDAQKQVVLTLRVDGKVASEFHEADSK